MSKKSFIVPETIFTNVDSNGVYFIKATYHLHNGRHVRLWTFASETEWMEFLRGLLNGRGVDHVTFHPSLDPLQNDSFASRQILSCRSFDRVCIFVSLEKYPTCLRNGSDIVVDYAYSVRVWNFGKMEEASRCCFTDLDAARANFASVCAYYAERDAIIL